MSIAIEGRDANEMKVFPRQDGSIRDDPGPPLDKPYETITISTSPDTEPFVFKGRSDTARTALAYIRLAHKRLRPMRRKLGAFRRCLAEEDCRPVELKAPLLLPEDRAFATQTELAVNRNVHGRQSCIDRNDQHWQQGGATLS